MTHPAPDPGFDGRVADWLEGDPDSAPHAVLATVVAAVPSITQRRRGRAGRPTRLAPVGLAAMFAGLMVVAVSVALLPTLPFSAGGTVRSSGSPDDVAFADTARIAGAWLRDDRIAFTATIPVGFQDERWRAATYDAYTGNGWVQTQDDSTKVPMAAGQPLLDATSEPVDPALTSLVVATVNPVGYREALVLAPGAVESVDRATTLDLFGTSGWFAGAELRDGSSGPYRVTAAALKVSPDASDATQGISADKLRAAGDAYPSEVIAKYTDVPANAVGPKARQLLDTMVALSPSANPYDLAATFEAYLHSPSNFTYDTDLTDVDCGTAGVVECFASVRRGYCLQYASTMAILLRDAIPGHPIPTRLVQGFLPGKVQDGVMTVEVNDAHAWVEVYFPGYGWIPFDPTVNVGQPTHLPNP